MDAFEKLTWLLDDWNTLLITVLSTILIYVAIIVITRINGLRTFAKMSSFDFAITIAIGSLIASTMLIKNQSVANGIVGLVVLIGLQAFVAFLRKRNDKFESIMTNTPVLLMEGTKILYKNLEATRVSQSDLYAKLREANVTHLEQVIVVVLETTGEMSVLHKGEPGDTISKELMKNVRYTKGSTEFPKSEGRIENSS